jgi:hypothetical protein
MRTRRLESGRVRVLMQCGECATWRVHDVRPRTVRALERQRSRDLARMESLTGRIDLPESTPEAAER